jgi:hypothetical protein
MRWRLIRAGVQYAKLDSVIVPLIFHDPMLDRTVTCVSYTAMYSPTSGSHGSPGVQGNTLARHLSPLRYQHVKLAIGIRPSLAERKPFIPAREFALLPLDAEKDAVVGAAVVDEGDAWIGLGGLQRRLAENKLGRRAVIRRNVGEIRSGALRSRRAGHAGKQSEDAPDPLLIHRVSLFHEVNCVEAVSRDFRHASLPLLPLRETRSVGFTGDRR